MAFNQDCPALARFPSPSADPQILRRHFSAIFLHFITYFGAFVQIAEAGPLHGRDVDEHIIAPAVRLNKTKTLGRVEPLHRTCRHARSPVAKQCPA